MKKKFNFKALLKPEPCHLEITKTSFAVVADPLTGDWFFHIPKSADDTPVEIAALIACACRVREDREFVREQLARLELDQ